ncbi:MAG: SCP2 sterol-binding domain-containing protein [Pseudomonadota bacterium]
MAEKTTYLSPEWRDAVEKKLQGDITPEQMNHLTVSMSNIYKNCPDGKEKYLFFQVDAGRFTKVLLGEGEPPEAEFRITGDYETFARISQSLLKSQRALMTGKLKLKGSMVKALKLASIADRMNKVISEVPTVF